MYEEEKVQGPQKILGLDGKLEEVQNKDLSPVASLEDIMKQQRAG